MLFISFKTNDRATTLRQHEAGKCNFNIIYSIFLIIILRDDNFDDSAILVNYSVYE